MQKKAGFSMIELMITIGIFSILAAIAIPSLINWLPGYRLRSAVRDLQSDIQGVRLRAIRENASVAMTFDTDGNSYTIFLDNGAGGGVAGNEVRDGSEILLKQVTMPNGISIFEAVFGVTDPPRFSFNGRGLPNLAGHVIMRTADFKFFGITLTQVGNVRTEVP